MAIEQSGWIRVAESFEEIIFNTNGIAELEVNGKRICMAKYNNVLVAFAHKCPHAGGLFLNGYIDVSGNVVCPVHRYKFCLKNGNNISGEGYFLKRWPVKVEDGIFINLGGL